SVRIATLLMYIHLTRLYIHFVDGERRWRIHASRADADVRAACSWHACRPGSSTSPFGGDVAVWQSRSMSAHHTFTAADAVELAVVERSGFIESRHIGSAAVVDPAGDVTMALGDVETPVFTRSTLKPLQALACFRA